MDWQQEGDTIKAHGANGRVYEIREGLSRCRIHLNGDPIMPAVLHISAARREAECLESALRKGESEREETHQQALARLNLQPGDKVRVERKANSCENGWTLIWTKEMDWFVGKVCEVRAVREGDRVGALLEHDDRKHYFPAHVLTVVERAQKDEPAEAEDGYWVVHRMGEDEIESASSCGQAMMREAEAVAKANPGEEVYILKTVQRLKAKRTTTVESVPCVAKGDNHKGASNG